MVSAITKVLPVPVAPSSVWWRIPLERPSTRRSMAAGWSPVGWNGATSLKSGTARSYHSARSLWNSRSSLASRSAGGAGTNGSSPEVWTGGTVPLGTERRVAHGRAAVRRRDRRPRTQPERARHPPRRRRRRPGGQSMEVEYKDPSRRGRWIVVLGVVLAVVAGGAAFFLINNAQQKASTTGLKTVSGYVAARPILANKPIAADDIALRSDIPLDGTNADVISDPAVLVDHLLAVDVPSGQLLTTNLLASGTVGLGFSILRPDETVAPDSEAWRAVAITVSDDRAVGGVIGAGMLVDVFVTASVTVEPAPGAAAPGASALPGAVTAASTNNNSIGSGYYSDRSTKITYQAMQILARSGTYYILKVPLGVAEEIAHMQADGTPQFSLALRPDQDTRILDVSGLGETTNRIIERYGLPVPESIPSRGRPYPTNPPIPSITPPPSPSPSAAPGDLGSVPVQSPATP